MKLLLDENLSLQHAVELRSAGYDAVAVLEAGLSGGLTLLLGPRLPDLNAHARGTPASRGK